MILQSVKEAARDTFVYTGRSERLEHWTFLLVTLLFVAVFQILGRFGVAMIFPVNYLFLIVFIWLILANISLMVRRLHDHNLSGFWLFLPVIPLTMLLISAREIHGSGVAMLSQSGAQTLFVLSQVSLVLVLVGFGSLFVRPGSKNSNRFGSPIV